MPLTLSQAARRCGRGKTTLLRAVRSGRISAARDETAGTWLIDEAELARVFPGPVHAAVQEPVNGALRNGADRAAVLEARLDEMLASQRLRDEMIADLRDRLDRSEMERREAQARVAALLSDQRPHTTDSPTGWGRFLAWRRGR